MVTVVPDFDFLAAADFFGAAFGILLSSSMVQPCIGTIGRRLSELSCGILHEDDLIL